MLVRNGSIVLFMNPDGDEAFARPKALRVYLWDRAKSDDVELQYETVLPGAADPFSTCASPVRNSSKTTLCAACACQRPLCMRARHGIDTDTGLQLAGHN